MILSTFIINSYLERGLPRNMVQTSRLCVPKKQQQPECHKVCRWSERKLFLKVNATKTKVVRPTRSKYLGFSRLGGYRRSGMNVVNFIISKDLFENSILLIAYLV